MNKTLVWGACLSLGLMAFGSPDVEMRLDGSVTFGETGFSFRPSVVEKGWAQASLTCPAHKIAAEKGSFVGRFAADGREGRVADVRLSLSPGTDDVVTVAADFTSRVAEPVEALMLAGTLPSRYANGVSAADGGAAKPHPAVGRQLQFRASRVVFSAPDARDATFAFASPVTVVLRRAANGSVQIRFAPVYHGTLEKGRRYAVAMSVGLGERFALARQELYRVVEGEEWVAWDDVKDIEPGSALDFSSLGFADAPAGKYGWLKNVGGRFEFEGRPGVPVRFAGVNFCGTMNYPSHAEADRIVRRLKALGYNSIRLHHYDRDLVRGSADNLTFDVENLDRLDYLVAKAIESGLYVTTDLYVSRPVTWRQMGIDRDGSPRDVPEGRWLFKLLIAFHEGAYANWKAFATVFMTHVNPYTGRRYADEPGMPLLSMVNEANYRMGWKALVREESFRAKWKAWAEEKRRTDPGFVAGRDLADPSAFAWEKLGRLGDTAPAAFLADTEAKNFARQLADMRALGAKALFTSINHLPFYAPDLAVRRKLYGYFDDHLYVDHPRFPGKAWKLPTAHGNLNPALDPDCRLDKHAYMRLVGLPSTLSEFNFCGPNDYRNMNALLTGAFMAGQDRSGYWRFAYAHSLSNMYDRVGRPGSFDVSTDPLNCAAERMVHFLYLRGDFAPFEPSVALVLPDARAATRGEKMSQMFPEWRQAFAWKARLACAFPADVPAEAQTVDHLTTCGAAEAPFALADDPRLVIDRAAGTVRLATARSCGVSVGRGKLAAGALAVDVRRGGPMTTVGVASLDAAPLATSRRLLLLHLTDADATGATYTDRTRKLKIAAGQRQPTLIRDGEAEIRLALDEPSSFDVYGLDAAGRRTGTVAATVEDGALAFTARVRGERGARMCYEIVRREDATK